MRRSPFSALIAVCFVLAGCAGQTTAIPEPTTQHSTYAESNYDSTEELMELRQASRLESTPTPKPTHTTESPIPAPVETTTAPTPTSIPTAEPVATTEPPVEQPAQPSSPVVEPTKAESHLTCADIGWDVPSSNPNYRTYLDANGNGVACESEKSAPAPVAPIAPVNTAPAYTPPPAPAPVPAGPDMYVAVNTSGGQAQIDACVGPVLYGGNIIAQHDYCGGARFLNLSVGDTVQLSGITNGLYKVSGIAHYPVGSTSYVVPSYYALQTCTGGDIVRLVYLVPA